MRNWCLVATAVGMGSLWGAADRDVQTTKATTPPFGMEVRPLASPATGSSAHPQLAVSARGGVLLSWIERAGTKATLNFAERLATGWSAARVVASGDDWFVNWADVPSVLRLSDGTLAAHWLQKTGPGTYAYDVRLSYSKNDGRTWAPSFTPHHDGTKTEHGFASLFPMPGGGLGLVWLDGRAMKPELHDAPAGGNHGAMSVRFGAFDRNWKQVAEAPVDLRVCECCPTAAAVTAEGPIAAFRNRTHDEIRDIYVSRLENGRWTEPTAVHNDNWHITGCPVNGPMLSARGRNVALAWFTMSEGQSRALVSFSSDAGRTFGPPIRLDDGGSLGRVDLKLAADGSAIASWIEYAGQRAEFRARRIEPSGARSLAVTVATLNSDRSNGYPRIAMHGDELIFAWTESTRGSAGPAGNTVRVMTAVARVPRGR